MAEHLTRFRLLIQERRWTYEAFCVQWRRACEELAAQDGDPRLAALPLSRRTFDRWMQGDISQRGPRPDAARVLAHLTGISVEQLFTHDLSDLPPSMSPKMSQDDVLRSRLEGILASGNLSPTALQTWEESIAWHGRATRILTDEELLAGLRSDFQTLSTALDRRQPLSVMRQLTRLSAQMAGLMSLVLLRTGDVHNARAWVRVARIAATEVNDPAVMAWTLAEEAYALFYSGDAEGAVQVARRAQQASRQPTVGAALAAPLEARAHGLLGQSHEAHRALDRAEVIFANLRGDDIGESAFAYNEAQLRFHQGNVLTHLGATQQAREAQARALALYARDEHLDRALIKLDVAVCTLKEGDAAMAAKIANVALLDLPTQHRSGLLLARAHQLDRALPAGRVAPEAVRAFRDMLAAPASEAAPALNQTRTNP
jgi:tetratricopeptide (TPR) repeat protein